MLRYMIHAVHRDLSKYHETRIHEGALKIITRNKIRTRSSKNIAPKQIIIDLLLYASSSLYWIVLATVYLHFYLLNFDIRRIFDILRSSSSAPTPFL